MRPGPPYSDQPILDLKTPYYSPDVASKTKDKAMRCCPLVALVMVVFICQTASAQLDFEGGPINYHETESHDPVARLQRAIDSRQVVLANDAKFGFLPALLEHFGISTTSQVLVYSKTSFQNSQISPTTPRAIYFGDDIYVGRVIGSDTLELAAIDDHLGSLFYTLRPSDGMRPEIVRDRGQCLICHASRKTQGVPGVLVRSVYPGKNGLPFFGSKTYTSDHTSPFAERWGGWYVTGSHGTMRHMGNMTFDSREDVESYTSDPKSRTSGTNQTTLAGRFDLSSHLSAHSDLVSLMVLEHQTQMQNVIVRAHFEGVTAADYQQRRNKSENNPEGFVAESTARRYASSAERVVRCLLFVDEFRLLNEVRGTTDFATQFEAKGLADSKGRSLRQFDLRRRLFKFPCSYMIYTPSFDGLHANVREVVFRRLWEILDGQDKSEDYRHLTSTDRQAIKEILIATKKGLPSYWK